MNACVRIVALTLASCYSLSALAQDKTGQDKAGRRDDLDVTMQIIVDPNAKLPDEVVRRIPLPPVRSPATTTPPAKASDTKPEAARKDSERAEESKETREPKEPREPRDARDLGREAAETARERARDAQQQREEARNSDAKERERDRDRGPPDRPNPGPPPRN
jgi:hypothetical protein